MPFCRKLRYDIHKHIFFFFNFKCICLECKYTEKRLLDRVHFGLMTMLCALKTFLEEPWQILLKVKHVFCPKAGLMSHVSISQHELIPSRPLP